jgi:hypothetical protein
MPYIRLWDGRRFGIWDEFLKKTKKVPVTPWAIKVKIVRVVSGQKPGMVRGKIFCDWK